MTAMFLWINIPLMALAFGLWTGLPLWMVFRHPDKVSERRIGAGVPGQRPVRVPAPRVPVAQRGAHARRDGVPAVPRQGVSSERRPADA
jgi:hypothetical protein